MFANAVDYEPDTDEGTSYYDREQYVMWGFSSHGETLNLPGNPAVLSGQDATAPVMALIDEWHPALKWLVQTTDVSTVTAFAVKTSVPIRPWPTQQVMLLGDALHNMTPFRGIIGANTALRDAAALRPALVAVTRGPKDLTEALAVYERDMIEYGFAAVRTSRNDMERFHAGGRLARTAVKSLFRTIDYIPPLQSAFLGRLKAVAAGVFRSTQALRRMMA